MPVIEYLHSLFNDIVSSKLIPVIKYCNDSLCFKPIPEIK